MNLGYERLVNWLVVRDNALDPAMKQHLCWEQLPFDVLKLIFEIQANALDNCAAACTCKAWRDAVHSSQIHELRLHATSASDVLDISLVHEVYAIWLTPGIGAKMHILNKNSSPKLMVDMLSLTYSGLLVEVLADFAP
ncbi:hypothetical protein WJX82_007373 [Trebouxia sp. C0006]